MIEFKHYTTMASNFSVLTRPLYLGLALLCSARPHTVHICLESNLANFDIPNIPKTVLRSPKRAVSHHAMGNALSKNVPVYIFTSYTEVSA